MRKGIYGFLCLVTALALVLSCFCTAAFAADTHSVIVDYDSALGSVGIEINGVSASSVGIASDVTYDNVWKASAALTGGTTVKIMDGITITPAEDFSYSTVTATTINSVDFTGAVKGTNNGNVSSDGVSGVVFKVDAERTGTLYFALSLNTGKGVRAVNVNDISTYVLNYTNETGATQVDIFGFDVQAGESYYFWPTGTKPNTYGAFFKEKVISEAAAGDTVTIKPVPSEGNYIGNVSLGDDSVALTTNSGMTECTFTMPDNDIEVEVEFISSEVYDEIQEISFDEIKGGNASESEIYEDLELFDGHNTAAGYADVSWESSNEAVISISGDVNGLSTDTQVDLTAVFTWQDYPNLRITKTFNLTVPADTDDDAAVAAAKEALTLGDTSAVKKSIELPTVGKRNTAIAWSSSNPSVVAADGTVTPVWEQETTVILTATISRGSATPVTKEFTIVVSAQYALTVERIAVSNEDGDVVVTPADGDYISHIVITDNIENKSEQALLAAVYDSDGKLLDAGVITLASLAEEQYSDNDGQTIIYLDKLSMDKISVSTGCTVKVFALDSISTMKPATSQSVYVYDTALASSPTIYVAGDSTACTYSTTGSKNAFPRTGWAQVLGDYFSGATVNDLALSGRSSLSFRSETNYTTIKNKIKAGDYFVIQFGHNDSKSGDTARYTDASGDRFTDGSFKNSLTEYYVNVALDKGANPILTTSISRRSLSDSGLEAYVNATRELGYELGLPVVDLYAKTNGYINEVGVDQAMDIFAYILADDPRFVKGAVLPASYQTSLGKSTIDEIGDFANSQYVGGSTDNTHIHYYGAQMVSQWFCDELERLGYPLTSLRSSHVTTLDDIPSYSEAAASQN